MEAFSSITSFRLKVSELLVKFSSSEPEKLMLKSSSGLTHMDKEKFSSHTPATWIMLVELISNAFPRSPQLTKFFPTRNSCAVKFLFSVISFIVPPETLLSSFQ